MVGILHEKLTAILENVCSWKAGLLTRADNRKPPRDVFTFTGYSAWISALTQGIALVQHFFLLSTELPPAASFTLTCVQALGERTELLNLQYTVYI